MRQLSSHTNSKPNNKANRDGFRISNLTLLGVIAALGTGVLLDGKLYNKRPQQAAIHALGDAQTIELQFAGEQILSFDKINNNWQQSYPVSAPVQAQRLQVLLDTNKYSQRKYAATDIPEEDIFVDPIKLKINDAEYDFGSIEPVSRLRYVRSGDLVYLQPDTVVPLLSASNNAFLDLQITHDVENITIGETTLEQPDTWSNLQAVDVIDDKSSGPALDIEVISNKKSKLLKAKHSDSGYTISEDNGFTYLLDPTTAESLGLTDLLPKKMQTPLQSKE